MVQGAVSYVAPLVGNRSDLSHFRVVSSISLPWVQRIREYFSQPHIIMHDSVITL